MSLKFFSKGFTTFKAKKTPKLGVFFRLKKSSLKNSFKDRDF